MKIFLVLFALFAASLAHADCVEVNGKQYCAKDTSPKCITSEGAEYCKKDSAPVATAQPQVVYVQPQPSIYYGPAYYPYYYGAPVGFVFRFGGGHHRH